MAKRVLRKREAALARRVAGYNQVPKKTGYKKPGSMNRHKGISTETTNRQHRGGAR